MTMGPEQHREKNKSLQWPRFTAALAGFWPAVFMAGKPVRDCLFVAMVPAPTNQGPYQSRRRAASAPGQQRELSTRAASSLPSSGASGAKGAFRSWEMTNSLIGNFGSLRRSLPRQRTDSRLPTVYLLTTVEHHSIRLCCLSIPHVGFWRHRPAWIYTSTQEIIMRWTSLICLFLLLLSYSSKWSLPQLLGELLLDRHNFTVMTRYISKPENLKLMMNLLRDKSPNIQFEAFHVFKVKTPCSCMPHSKYGWISQLEIKNNVLSWSERLCKKPRLVVRMKCRHGCTVSLLLDSPNTLLGLQGSLDWHDTNWCQTGSLCLFLPLCVF